ncbi:nucleosidase [Dysgonomonas sp. BGC7]|uniref:5'-methylthioadenosine/S-adenosylhomocysteine nucleosidase family protein n=1 Tax=Dysgonomonas sp. BGC7 TaxID=1658008 RepID=UPI00068312A8|nr:nucleosidase [Dysgonomonas sp. BGC7]MBD8388471.1 nucleosidase [Dysgonomonas sp. BGC7]
MKKVLVTYAVKEEFDPITLNGCEMRYVLTGIGKTMASMKLTEALCKERPDIVLNIGTAGTIQHNIGDIFVCREFIDRDFQAVKLPGIEYQIGFDANESANNWLSAQDKTGICSTGDSFVTQAKNIDEDVIDMEAFAQAVVCKEFGVSFVAVKYITDIVGQNSVKHWEEKLSDARIGLHEWFSGK